MKKESSEEKIKTEKRYQELFYKKYYDAWKGLAHDDRLLFCNEYDMIMDALDAMQGIENSTVWCGVHYEINKYREQMDKILEEFKERENIA